MNSRTVDGVDILNRVNTINKLPSNEAKLAVAVLDNISLWVDHYERLIIPSIVIDEDRFKKKTCECH